MCLQGFPGGSDSKEYFCNAGDPGWFLPLGRSPGEGNGYPLQYSCLENTMIRGAWRSMVHGITKGQTWLSDQHFQLFYFYVFLMPQSYSESMTKKQYLSLRLLLYWVVRASLTAQLVKNLPAMQETRDWFKGQEDPLEKEMATHSSILAWKIPWTEEPGGLQSMGSQESDTT